MLPDATFSFQPPKLVSEYISSFAHPVQQNDWLDSLIETIVEDAIPKINPKKAPLKWFFRG